MNKHTPGPWRLAVKDDEYGLDLLVVGHLEGDYVPVVCGFLSSEADGHLIAAAPELLEVLEEIVAHSDRIGRDSKGKPYRTPECQRMHDKACAAISKAKGE